MSSQHNSRSNAMRKTAQGRCALPNWQANTTASAVSSQFPGPTRIVSLHPKCLTTHPTRSTNGTRDIPVVSPLISDITFKRAWRQRKDRFVRPLCKSLPYESSRRIAELQQQPRDPICDGEVTQRILRNAAEGSSAESWLRRSSRVRHLDTANAFSKAVLKELRTGTEYFHVIGAPKNTSPSCPPIMPTSPSTSKGKTECIRRLTAKTMKPLHSTPKVLQLRFESFSHHK